MGDSYGDPQRTKRYEGAKDSGRSNFRNSRGGNNRESGGFRIRLSDNEMRSAKIIQEAFNLRSTVAVLGFALRTLGQLIEQGKIDDLIDQHRSNSPNDNFARNQTTRGGRRDEFNSHSNSKPNPFARPAKPEPDKETEQEVNSVESNINSAESSQSETTTNDQDIESSQDTKDNNKEEGKNQSTSKE